MSRTFILAQSDVTARSLGAWLELAGGSKLVENDPRILGSTEIGDPSKAFDEISPRISAIFEQDGSELKILVDSVRPEGLNPLAQSGWDALVAMLILAFPKIRWFFGVCGDWPDGSRHLADFHALPALFAADYDPMFDGSGLRDLVRRNMRQFRMDGDVDPAGYLPERREWSAALDDEASYANFNAYAAYRWGFRSFAVTRNRLAKFLFEEDTNEGSHTPKNHSLPPSHLTFEDIFLNYPDRDRNDHYSELSNHDEFNRVKGLPLLCNADYRIFVSASQTRTGDTSRRLRNDHYVRYNSPEPPSKVFAKEIHKPLAGMFDIWERSTLKHRLPNGKAPEFVWPPTKASVLGEEKTGHGAPGRLLQIAEVLIHRAETIMKEGITSVEQAVHGAILATDALELLGSKTPTTSIEALGLKHAFEVTAECQFSGVEYHICMRDRLDEIARETEVISSWFNPLNKKVSAWNAEMHIVNRLVRILRDHNQFDEEQVCANRSRHLHHTLWMCSTKISFIPGNQFHWGYVFWLPLRYLEFLLGSFLRFCGALVAWTFLISFAFMLVEPFRGKILANPDTAGAHLASYLSYASTALFGTEPAISYHPIWIGTAFLASIVGIAHLGIFISHLYTVVSRK